MTRDNAADLRHVLRNRLERIRMPGLVVAMQVDDVDVLGASMVVKYFTQEVYATGKTAKHYLRVGIGFSYRLRACLKQLRVLGGRA